MLKRLIGLIMGLFVLTGVQPTEAPLQTFGFQYGGMFLPNIVGIDVQQAEDGYSADFLLGSSQNIEGISLDASEIETIRELIDEYDLWAWAGFDKVNTMALDGESFSLWASFADGTRIQSHGSNAFPEGYDAARDAILGCVEDLMIAHGLNPEVE